MWSLCHPVQGPAVLAVKLSRLAEDVSGVYPPLVPGTCGKCHP
jgi:hypothetical protein